MASVTSLKKLTALGKRYKVDKEEDFEACAKTFIQEASLIAQMRAQVKSDGLTVTKSYVKGGENLSAHPLLSEIQKHVDCWTLSARSSRTGARSRNRPMTTWRNSG